MNPKEIGPESIGGTDSVETRLEGFCEHSNAPVGSLKTENFLHHELILPQLEEITVSKLAIFF
jgi:hypothetical protein